MAISSWLSALAVLILCRLNCMFSFPHLASRAECGTGLYRLMSVAFSSYLIVLILRPSQNVTSVLAMSICQHLPRSLTNVNETEAIRQKCQYVLVLI